MKMKSKIVNLIKFAITLLALSMTLACNPNTKTPPQPEQPPAPESPAPETAPSVPKVKTLKELINAAQNDETIDLGSVEFTATENDSYTIKANNLTLKNGNVKNATFVVQGKNVTFENLTNIYSLTVDAAVKDADFTMKNCHRVEDVFLNGGGSKSIHISDTEIGKLIANKQNLHIQLDDAGITKIEKVFVFQDCSLDSKNIANTLKSVIITEAVENLELAGTAIIDKIVSTVDKNESKVVVTVNEDITITAADEAIRESISENTANADFNAKADVIEDAELTEDEKKETAELDKICATYTLDLGDFLYDVSYYSSSELRPVILYITDCFKKMPKKDETVNIKFSGDLIGDLPKLKISLCNSGGEIISDSIEIQNCKDSEKITVNEIVRIKSTAIENIYLRFDFTTEEFFNVIEIDGNDDRPIKGAKGNTIYLPIVRTSGYYNFHTDNALIDESKKDSKKMQKVKGVINSVKVFNPDFETSVWVQLSYNSNYGWGYTGYADLKIQETPQEFEVLINDVNCFGGYVNISGCNAIVEVGEITIEEAFPDAELFEKTFEFTLENDAKESYPIDLIIETYEGVPESGLTADTSVESYYIYELKTEIQINNREIEKEYYSDFSIPQEHPWPDGRQDTSKILCFRGNILIQGKEYDQEPKEILKAGDKVKIKISGETTLKTLRILGIIERTPSANYWGELYVCDEENPTYIIGNKDIDPHEN